MLPQKLTAQLAHARAALFRHTLNSTNAQGSSHSTTSAILPYFQKSANYEGQASLAGSASGAGGSTGSASPAGSGSTGGSYGYYARAFTQMNPYHLHLDSSNINSVLGVSRGDDRKEDNDDLVEIHQGQNLTLIRNRQRPGVLQKRRRRWSLTGIDIVPAFETLTLPQLTASRTGSPLSAVRQLHTESHSKPPPGVHLESPALLSETRPLPRIQTLPQEPSVTQDLTKLERISDDELRGLRDALRQKRGDLVSLRGLLDGFVSRNVRLPPRELEKLVHFALEDRTQYYKGLRAVSEWARLHKKDCSQATTRNLAIAIFHRAHYVCDAIKGQALHAQSSFLNTAARAEIREKLQNLEEDKAQICHEIAYLVRSEYATFTFQSNAWSFLIETACKLGRSRDAQAAARFVESKIRLNDTSSHRPIKQTSKKAQKDFWMTVMQSFSQVGDVQGVRDAQSVYLELIEEEDRAEAQYVSESIVTQAIFNAGRTIDALKNLENLFDSEAALPALESLEPATARARQAHKQRLLASVSEAFARQGDLEQSKEWLEHVSSDGFAMHDRLYKTHARILELLSASQAADWNEHLALFTLQQLRGLFMKPPVLNDDTETLAHLNIIMQRLTQQIAKRGSSQIKEATYQCLSDILLYTSKTKFWQLFYPSTLQAILHTLPQLENDSWQHLASLIFAGQAKRAMNEVESTWNREQICLNDTFDPIEYSSRVQMTFLQYVSIYGAIRATRDVALLKQIAIRLVELYKAEAERTPDFHATLREKMVFDLCTAVVGLAEVGYKKDEMRDIFRQFQGSEHDRSRPIRFRAEELQSRAKVVFGKEEDAASSPTAQPTEDTVSTQTAESSNPDLAGGESSVISTPPYFDPEVPHLIFDEALSTKVLPTAFITRTQLIDLYEQVRQAIEEQGRHPGLGSLLALAAKAGRTGEGSLVADFQKYMYRIAGQEADPVTRGNMELEIDTTCTRAFAETGDLERSRVLRDKILASGVPIPGDIYGTWITKISGTNDEAGKALAIYTEAKSLPLVPTLYFYNTIISRLCKARQIDHAIAILQEMQAADIRPSRITFGALISGCCRVGDLESADYLLQQMIKYDAQLKTSTPAFNSIIQAYLALGDKPACRRYFDLMTKHSVHFNSQTFKLMIEMQATIKPIDMNNAYHWRNQALGSTGIAVTSQHCIPFIRGWGIVLNNLKNAVTAFREVPNLLRRDNRTRFDQRTEQVMRHDAEAYEAIFEVFVHHCRYNLVEEYYDQMKREHIAMTPYVANILIKSRAQGGNLDKARKLFDNMLHDTQSSQGGLLNDPSTGLPFRQPSTYEAMILAERNAAEPDDARIHAILTSLDAQAYPEQVTRRIRAIAENGEEPKLAAEPMRLNLGQRANLIRHRNMSTSIRHYQETTQPNQAEDCQVGVPVGEQPALANSPAPPPRPGKGARSADRGTRFKAQKAAMTLTPRALNRLKSLLDSPTPQLIRVGVRNKGCAGMSYHLEYTDKPGKFDEIVEQDGVKVLIDSKALFSIIGSEMDYVEDRLSQGFRFWNPQVAEECGCGSSFALRERPSMDTAVDQPV